MPNSLQTISILGSTGSVGVNALAVIREHPGKFQVFALVGGTNVEVMLQQCVEFRPQFACMADSSAAEQLRTRLKGSDIRIEVLSGSAGSCELAAAADADVVVAAIVGTAGLAPTLAAVRAGKRILLANKESLVACGGLLLDAARRSGSQILPIDSEHNAIFQCLPADLQSELGHSELSSHGIANLVLTGSGGPFRELPLDALSRVTPEQACAHPVWSMGRKISVDSATMMNKGLEYIEARWLFNASSDQIEVLLHPQSIVHSMVSYVDGSFIAQMGAPDMRTSIACGLAHPQRISVRRPQFDFTQKPLEFMRPEPQRYPCLFLAIEALSQGQVATTALNAANEISVAAFLNSTIKFTDIAKINRRVSQGISAAEPSNIDDALEIDLRARSLALHVIAQGNF
jgi:1-deoxy-D-xylulose-5-phosphate reductoisomerase